MENQSTTTPDLDPARFEGLPPLLPTRPYAPLNTGKSPEQASREFYETLDQRRSCRFFSDRPVSRETIENICLAAGTAPSGAHKQPWRFVCVQDPALKAEIRQAAENEEREFYERRATRKWLEDLSPLGTDSSKPFITTAPWIIVAFALAKTDTGGMVYYREESVGLACGMLISAIHHAGLATLTHTPSPLKFLSKVLNRPDHERPFLLLPVGYPADNATVPDLQRKPLTDIMVVDRQGPAK